MAGGITHFYPFIKTPFTDIGAHMCTHQSYGKCNDFEMRAVECIEAYGHNKMESKCGKYLADLDECRQRTKVVSYKVHHLEILINLLSKNINLPRAPYLAHNINEY